MGSNPATPTKKPPEKDFLRRGSKKREISYGEKYCSGCSAVRLARQLRELEVAGSNPVSPTKIKTFALKGKGFLLWAYDGYSSPKVRVQEKRIPLYQAGSLIFVHPIRDSSGSEAERRNPVFPTERRDTKTFLFSFPDSDMSHGKRTAIKNCLRNSFCLCIIIRKSKCSTDFKRNDFLKKNEAYPLGALRSLKFAYRKLRISLFVELAV